jgi:uncharacterized protein YecE (DUF72 family)
MARYWIGTSGYTHKEWKDTFYPASLADQDQLGFYAARFASVELNYTFYRTPSVRTLQGWAKETPELFAFTLKAPRTITHDLRLRDAADAVSDFCDTTRALKSKLGALLFQVPPFLKRDLPRLEDFLHQMPPGFNVAFEFRNPSWLADEVYDCMRRFDVALCVVHAPDRPVPWEATAGFGYFRLRQPDYSDEDLQDCARRIADLARGWREVFVYFKHEAAGRGPVLAGKLRDFLEQADTLAAVEIPA